MAPRLLREHSPMLRRRRSGLPVIFDPARDPIQPDPGSAVQRISVNNYMIDTQLLVDHRPALPVRDRNMATMMLVFSTGVHREIIFPLPRQNITVQDLLRQCGVHFERNTIIQCEELGRNCIDIVVRVGFYLSRLLTQWAAAGHGPPLPSPLEQISPNNYTVHPQHVRYHEGGRAKMFIIQVSGQNVLVTFTLPGESCTVQDLLQQFGVTFDNSTNIRCWDHQQINGHHLAFLVSLGLPLHDTIIRLSHRALQLLRANDYSSKTL
ncbi:uncharacterized protein [Drosophila bipectinata]|uniref:uncharacterized protein n=1 Tax=Drosophila bipectinata TaxID=42026 RepID=UPI001C8A1BD1|nr:uncharacterized protein LOC108124230 [Drosophila bipectinata]